MNDAVRQNLIDAGCNEKFIAEFETYFDDKKKCEKLLAMHRKALLEKIHKEEQQISCLDYLVYTMKKEKAQ